MYAAQSQDNCLVTGNENGLPPLPDQGYDAGPASRIHHRHQAIIPSYRLNCCGNITEWGVDLNPDVISRFDFILQVWRPAYDVNETGCYGLVDDLNSTEIQLNQTIGVARITPLPSEQLQFQPGDVLGFYVESHAGGSDDDNGVALLTSGNYTSEVVWHGSIGGGTAQTSKTASCLYPIRATGVLRSSTHAAPAISISITTYSCHQISSTIIASSISPTRSIQSTISASNIHVPSTTIPTVSNEPASVIHNIGLIFGVVTASIIICVSTITITTIIIAITIAKRCRKFNISTSSNEAYGELIKLDNVML